MDKKYDHSYDSPKVFNLRVYGVWILDNHIMLSEESHNGLDITKFPGGGMKFGEGTLDCLKREFMEELGLDIHVRNHLFTTDFFQESVFNPAQQVIGIYYLVEKPDHNINDPLSGGDPGRDQHNFRWVPLRSFEESLFTFPTDQAVARILLNEIRE